MLDSFTWIIADALAGSCRPGARRPLEDDLESLRLAGVGMIVSLGVRPLELPLRSGFSVIHAPMPHLGSPSVRTLAGVCRRVLAAIGHGDRVLLQGESGVGNTGTLAACCLVSLGLTPQEAFRELEARSGKYRPTASQRELVGAYTDFLLDLDDEGRLGVPFLRPGSLPPHSLTYGFTLPVAVGLDLLEAASGGGLWDEERISK